MSSIKEVRNVLANELGLSREVITTMIDQRIEKLFKDLSMETLVERCVDRTLSAMVKETRWSSANIKTLIEGATREFLRDKLVVSFDKGEPKKYCEDAGFRKF